MPMAPSGYTPVDTTSANSLVTDYHPVIVPFAFSLTKTWQSEMDYWQRTSQLHDGPSRADLQRQCKELEPVRAFRRGLTLCLCVAGSGNLWHFAAGVMKTNDVGPYSAYH